MDVRCHRDIDGIDLFAEIIGDVVAYSDNDGRCVRIEAGRIDYWFGVGQQAVWREAQPLYAKQELVDGKAFLHRVARAGIVQPPLEIDRIGGIRGVGHERSALHQPSLQIGGQAQAKEMHERQMAASIEKIIRRIVEPMRLPAPEQREITG